MPRIVFASVSAFLLSVGLGGCSLFGIATKSELQQQAQSTETRQRQLDETTKQLRAELAALSETLESVGGQMEQSYAEWATARQRADSERQALERLVWELDQRLGETGSAIEQLDESVRSEMDGLQGEVTAARSGVEVVQGEIGSVRSQSAMADERSLTALRVIYERLLRERQRLSQELDSIERELNAWREQGLIGDGSSSLLP